MIKVFHTAVCYTAVLGPERPHNVASMTKSAQRILSLFPLIKINCLKVEMSMIIPSK